MKTQRPDRGETSQAQKNTCESCSQSRVGRKEFKCFLVCGQRTDAYPSALSVAVLRLPRLVFTLLRNLSDCKSRNAVELATLTASTMPRLGGNYCLILNHFEKNYCGACGRRSRSALPLKNSRSPFGTLRARHAGMDGRHRKDASGDIHVGLIPALHAGMTESRSRTQTDRGPPPFLFSKEEITKVTK
jgi:hypothetical protein